MKILYISAEHVSGTLSLFQAEHRRRGDECRFVTFWHSKWDFPDDICLNLPLMPNQRSILAARRMTTWLSGGGVERPAPEAAPYWNPGLLGRSLHRIRDFVLWPRIQRAIRENNLEDFDIVHLDGGLDFTRDARFARSMRNRGKHVAAYYHGSDLRTRGLVRAVDEIAGLRLTCEWDLIELDPRLHYLYLPFQTDTITPRPCRFHNPVRICHATRNPYKGTRFIEAAVQELSRKYPVELVLLRDLPHAEALRRKYEADIFVDQLTNEGGWGYGMSSVEAFAMGMPVVTNIPMQMRHRLGDHPFVQADPETVTAVLADLVNNPSRCAELGLAGREWVVQRHDFRSVGDRLYQYYREAGWLKPKS